MSFYNQMLDSCSCHNNGYSLVWRPRKTFLVFCLIMPLSLIKYAPPFDISFSRREKFASITCSGCDFEGFRNTLRY